jgi:serine/threonine protein kinase
MSSSHAEGDEAPFTIKRLIGQGSFGRVYQAEFKGGNLEVAIKQIRVTSVHSTPVLIVRQ